MISIVIPTLNEAQHLPAALAAIPAGPPAAEVLVVDGGSDDATTSLAAAAGVRVIQSPRRGRAVQMNLGARHATGACLLFLHADTRLDPTALGALEAALRDPRVVGGAFARRFDCPSRLLRVTCRVASWRGRLLGWFFGDQAMFCRRVDFEAIGGFREWDLFEDLDLARRLKRRGRTVLLEPPVISAGRRFAARGPLRTSLADIGLTVRYLCGTDPQRLAANKKPRPGVPGRVRERKSG